MKQKRNYLSVCMCDLHLSEEIELLVVVPLPNLDVLSYMKNYQTRYISSRMLSG